MTDADFLAQIIANPDDDAPRLVYADWLEEQGKVERAGFIRAQIELAKPVSPPLAKLFKTVAGHISPEGIGKIWDQSESRQLVAAKAIQAATGSDAHFWLPPEFRNQPRGWTNKASKKWGNCWLSIASGLCWGIEWVRGFIDTVILPAADWLAHADALAWHPSVGHSCPPTAQPIRTVRLTTAISWSSRGGSVCLFDGYATRHLKCVSVTGNESTKNLLAAEWPGITFELPAQIGVSPLAAVVPLLGLSNSAGAWYDEAGSAITPEQFDRISQRLGVPAELINSASTNYSGVRISLDTFNPPH